MNAKNLEGLLDETMCGEQFAQHDFETRAAALREFRQLQSRKKLAGIGRIAAAFVLSAILLFLSWKPQSTTQNAGSALALSTQKAAMPKADQGTLMNDEQLLAAFPPGSCYIAEVDGRKMLVFRDEKVKRKFFN